MRKINFLKAVMGVAAAMLLTVNASGQIPADYVQYDANKTVPTNIDFVTVGKSLGYYALPDPVYHPMYTTDGSLTAGFTWTWGFIAAGFQAPTIGAPANNYVEIAFPTAGNYRIYVNEIAAPAFGSCASADSTVLGVTAVAAPSAGFTTADVINFCGPQLAQAINLAITEDVPVAMASYAFRVVRVRDNITSAGVRIGAALDSAIVAGMDFTLAAKGQVGVTAGFTGARPNYDYDFNSSALTVQNNLRTRYRYIVLPPANQVGPPVYNVGGTGIVSAISQKSDYLSFPAVSSTAFTDSQVVFIVNPAPVTGPIYYVPNTFNY